MSLMAEVIELIERLPADAVLELVKLVRAALSSPDPARELRRRAEADVAHIGAQEALKAALDRS